MSEWINKQIKGKGRRVNTSPITTINDIIFLSVSTARHHLLMSYTATHLQHIELMVIEEISVPLLTQQEHKMLFNRRKAPSYHYIVS